MATSNSMSVSGSGANFYQYSQAAADHEYPLDERARHEMDLERAPGLTLADVDRLLREAYVAGRKQGHAAGYETGFRSGRDRGERDGRRGIAEAVTQVIRGRLNHTQRYLAEMPQRPKTTIAVERQRVEQMAAQLDADINALAAIEGVDR